jgi:branched-chain amino acid transport system ATP-binding protein
VTIAKDRLMERIDDMDFLMRECHRVLVLDLGRVLAEGTPEKVRADPAVRAAYLGGE